jgi:hypothetical protein
LDSREETKQADLRANGQILMDSERSNPQNQKIVLETIIENTNNGQLFSLANSSLMALQEICKQFENARVYKEKEINEILKDYYDDYVTLRRYLIEHEFLERKPDGSQYWLKEQHEEVKS